MPREVLQLRLQQRKRLAENAAQALLRRADGGGRRLVHRAEHVKLTLELRARLPDGGHVVGAAPHADEMVCIAGVVLRPARSTGFPPCLGLLRIHDVDHRPGVVEHLHPPGCAGLDDDVDLQFLSMQLADPLEQRCDALVRALGALDPPHRAVAHCHGARDLTGAPVHSHIGLHRSSLSWSMPLRVLGLAYEIARATDGSRRHYGPLTRSGTHSEVLRWHSRCWRSWT